VADESFSSAARSSEPSVHEEEVAEKLRTEEYRKDQIVEGKWRLNSCKENANPQTQEAVPLADA